MTGKFNVGDRVRVVRAADYGGGLVLEAGRVYTVVQSDPRNVDNNDGGHGGWEPDRFELVEPAEVGQATAILDDHQDDGWWDVSTDVVMPGGVAPTFDDEDLQRLGLEVRVQVRRVQS